MDTQKRKVRKLRPCPPNNLGEPQKRFADTFHAVTLLEERYFPNKNYAGEHAAEADPGDPVFQHDFLPEI